MRSGAVFVESYTLLGGAHNGTIINIARECLIVPSTPPPPPPTQPLFINLEHLCLGLILLKLNCECNSFNQMLF